MIKINRGKVPSYMKSTAIKDAELKARNMNNKDIQKRFHYELSLLKPLEQKLLSIFSSKCAYCEQYINYSNSSYISTFRPVQGARGLNNSYHPNHYWWLAYKWENLLIACEVCDRKFKKDSFPIENEKFRAPVGSTGNDLFEEKALLIDPCNDNPQEHIEFDMNGNIKGKSNKGSITIEILGLNRIELVRKRMHVSSLFKANLQTLKVTKNLKAKSIKPIILEIEDLLSESPTQELIGLKRMIFEKWHKNNETTWNNIKYLNNKSIEEKALIYEQKYNFAQEENPIDIPIQHVDYLKRFTIRRIQIENFKSIEKIDLNIRSFEDVNKRESWLLLLGDNGIGKSSILQAIALALLSKKQLNKLKINPLDYLSFGKRSGKITIFSYEQDTPVILTFDKNGFYTKLKEPPTFILGYGSTRLLPKGPIKPDTKKEPYTNVTNLFDYTISLMDPNYWLNNVGESEFNERIAPALFDILSLKSSDKLIFKNQLSIESYNNKFDLQDFSDGYKTAIALVLDIMQTLSVDKANFHNSQAIVLIDEIGNHLHPRWRMKICGALRKAFPNIQFIVTTHEPLCLRGLSHGEVVVLMRDQNGKVKVIDSKLLPDHTLMQVDQLLTSDLFGLINIDNEVEKTYEEYYNLLIKTQHQKATKEEIDKMNILSSKIDKVMLGDNPKEQIFYTLLEETYAQKIRNEGFKTIEELKAETISDVKQILANKQIDW